MDQPSDHCLRLTRRSGIYLLNDVRQYDLLDQLKQRAGIHGHIHGSNFDDLQKAARDHGCSIQVEEEAPAC